jgi:AcrR family transcriptional regulator
MSSDDTRNALLDAAEALLGEVGYAAMSLRTLTARAGVNLAGVHYHFGSKEDVTKAALSRRIAPVNAERLRRLAAIEARVPGNAPLPADAIVAAFLAPALELAAANDNGPCAMLGRLIAEQPPFLREYLVEKFRAVAQRFAGSLVRAVPGLRLDEAYWRLHFTVGAMTHTMQHAAVMDAVSDGACRADAAGDVIDRLTAFCVAGATAPAAATAKTGTGDRTNTR